MFFKKLHPGYLFN